MTINFFTNNFNVKKGNCDKITKLLGINNFKNIFHKI